MGVERISAVSHAAVGIKHNLSGVTPAYQVERMLSRYTAGTKTYLTLQRIRNLMIERGAIFPAVDPVELRERRKANNG